MSIRTTRLLAGVMAMVASGAGAAFGPSELHGQVDGGSLVVGHSNTTPALVRILGGDPGGPIAEDEYGRVYVVTVDHEGVRTLTVGYPRGEPAP